MLVEKEDTITNRDTEMETDTEQPTLEEEKK